MKNFLPILLKSCLLIFVMASFFSCNEKNVNTVTPSEMYQIVDVEFEFKHSFLIKLDEGTALPLTSQQLLSDYLKIFFHESDFDLVTDIKVITNLKEENITGEESLITVMGKGEKVGSNPTPVARVFSRIVNNKTATNSGESFKAGESHKCEGDPCSCCEFKKRLGKIVGCKCDEGKDPSTSNCFGTGEGSCNHTITSG